MASASYIDAGAGAAAGSGTTIGVPYPATVAAGDVLVAHVSARAASGVTTPAGWTLVPSSSINSGGRSAAFYKVADGTETGSLTVTFTGSGGFGSNGIWGRMYRFTGGTTVEGGGSEGNTATVVPDHSVTTSAGGRLAVNLVMVARVETLAAFTGMTGGTWSEPVAEYTDATGGAITLQIETAPITGATTINGGSQSIGGASVAYSVIGFAILPPTIAVRQATETDLAQPITPFKTPAGPHATVNQTAETDLAQAITPVKTAAADTSLYFAIDFGNGFEDMQLPLQGTHRTRSMSIKRGRQYNLDLIEAGTLQSVMKNQDAALDPSNANSPYYGRVLPLLPVRMLRRKSGLTYELFRGVIERLQPEWTPPSYQDMLLDAADSFESLSSYPIVSGYATLTTSLTGTNNDLVFTAKEAGGQGDDITITYVVAGVSTPLTGVVNDPLTGNAFVTADPGSSHARHPLDSSNVVGTSGDTAPLTVTVQGTDITVNVATSGASAATSTANDILALIRADVNLSALVTVALAPGNDGTGVVTAQAQTALFGGKWPQESSGARIARVLNLIGWSVDLRALDAGQSFVVARGFSVRDNVSALQHIQEVADSELGYVFMSGAGVITFHDGAHRSTATRSTIPQAVFSDDGSGFPFIAIDPSFDKDRIVNEASVLTGQSGAVPQVASDTYSQTGVGSPPTGSTNVPPGGFGKRSVSRQTQLALDADALAQAQGIVSAFSYPRYRFDQIITLEDGSTVGWVEAVLGLEIGDLVTVRNTPPGNTTTTSYNAYVEMVQDDLAPGLPWKRTLRLTSASQSVIPGPGVAGALHDSDGDNMTLDSATKGILG